MKFSFYKLALAAGMLVVTSTSMAQSLISQGCVIAGPTNAQLTIEEYADFQCKYCAKGSNTMKRVLKEYGGKVKLVFRNMPLPSHPNAVVAAKAFSAVCLQGSALANAFQDDLFKNQDLFNEKGELVLYEVAERIGANLEQMKTDMESPEVAAALKADQKAAEAHKFRGTPSYMIGSEPVVGALPYNELKVIIDRELNR